jgi:hypothetical protein
MWITAAALLAAVLPAAAQYPGQITNADKNTSTLRAVAVFEWTGDEAHPKTSRLVPICIYDGHDLQEADIYLARPFPLALSSDVEYQLLQDGKPSGLFDIETAAREQGSWVGYGKHLPLPVAKPAPKQVAKIDEYDDSQSDTPVLHRKHHAGDADSGSGGSSGNSGPDPNAPPPDPDRPTLHKGGDASASSSSGSTNTNSGDNGSSTNSTQASNSGGPTLHRAGDASDDSSNSGSGGNSTQSSGSNSPTLHRGGDASGGDSSGGSGSASGSNGPTLHKGGDASSSSTGDTSNSGSGSSPASDPDRPVLKRTPDSTTASSAGSGDSVRPTLVKKKSEDESSENRADAYIDPNRPHLFRGKSAGFDGPVTPSLLGLPPDMHQEVAVSDLTDRPEHVWDYIWANPDDEAKMKAAMEDLARTALGLNPPPAPAKPAPKSKTTSTTHKPKPVTPPPPAPLVDEQFRVFELAYGSGATMVLSAHTDGTDAQEKFVTLVAQPDLYGNVAVLIKNVTDAAHLDDMPRMRLVDAVDALADNRGDLLFELRGSTQRQFALYRVLRGDATRIFLSNVDAIGVPTGQ